MFMELNPTLAYQRREEISREISSTRLENGLRAARGHRRERRWSSRLVRVLRASSNGPAEAVRANGA